MANGTENLNVQVAVEGAQQSAEQLRQVAAAQGSVASATTRGGQAAEAARVPIEGLAGVTESNADAQQRSAEAVRQHAEALAKLQALLDERGAAAASGASIERLHDLNFAVAQQSQRVEQYATEMAKLPKTQDDVNARTSDWIGILNRVHPALGQTALAATRMARIADDLAGTQINFAKAGETVIQTLTRYRGALLLGGAFAAAVAGINAIVGAYQREKKALEEVTEAIRKQQQARDDARRSRDQEQQSLEDILDKRREGGPGAEGAAQAQALRERLTGRLGASFGGAVSQAVGGLFGTGADDALIEQAAVAIAQGRLEFAPGQNAASRLKRAQRATSRFGPQITQTMEREREQRGASEREAAQVARSGAGSTVAIEDFIRSLPGLEGEDAPKLAEIVRGLRAARSDASEEGASLGVLLPGSKTSGRFKGALRDRLVGQGSGFSDLESTAAALQDQGIGTDLQPHQLAPLVRLGELILIQLEKRGEGVTVQHINQQGSTFNGADAASRRARTRNGETATDQGLAGD